MKMSPIRSLNRVKNAAAKTRKGQLGLSILGALLALVIGALLTIPVINAFLDSQRKTRVENNLQDMRTIIADAQRNFGSTNQFAALTTATAIQSSVIPQRLRVTGTNSAQNGYNGSVEMRSGGITVANDTGILVWSNIPRDDCSDLVFGIEQLTRGVIAGGVQVKPNDGVLNAAALAGACDATATSQIEMNFGRKG